MNEKQIRVSLCSLPPEGAGEILNRKRSEGPTPNAPKVAITNLVKQMEKGGFLSWDFYDIDMLYPKDEDIRNYFVFYKPDVVGLSAVVSTSYSQVKRVSSIIRSVLPRTWMVMGGNLSASAEIVLNYTEVDLCVCGDGEIAWVEILRHILKYPDRNDTLEKEKLYQVKGVAFIDSNKEFKLNGFGESIASEFIEYPDYEIMKKGLKNHPEFLMNYFRPGSITQLFDFDERSRTDDWKDKNMASLFTSKGCVGRCTFCQRSTKGYKKLSIENLEKHLIYLKNNFNVGFIKLLDECFGADKRHGYKVADLFWKHGMLWYALTRTKCINEEDLDYYRNRGASMIKFGIESGSQTMLNIMDKRATIEDTLSAVSLCIQKGMDPSFSALLGMPGETENTVKQTGRLLGEIAAARGVHPKMLVSDAFYTMPHQGTPLWVYGQMLGVIPSKLKDIDEFMMKFSYYSFYKRFYINLNGAPVKEVIFWDYLLKLEAARVFWSRVDDVKKTNKLYAEYKASIQNQKKINPRLSLKYKALKFTFMTHFVDTYIIGNSLAERLPQWIIYPFVKYLLYIEYLIQEKFSANQKYPIFEKKGKVDRLINDNDESLRRIVEKKYKQMESFSYKDDIRYLLNIGPY
jgi:radical SAM superfamily enzyme YgiQ (UPF0313 family)